MDFHFELHREAVLYFGRRAVRHPIALKAARWGPREGADKMTFFNNLLSPGLLQKPNSAGRTKLLPKVSS